MPHPTRPAGHRPPSRRGFTLVELLIALVVAGVLAGLAMPRVDATRARADAAAAALRGTLQHAQRLALLRQHDIMVSFDTAAGVLRLAEDRNNNGRVDVEERLSRRSIETARFATPARRLDGTGGSGTLEGALAAHDSLPTLVFRRDGSASAEAEIYFVATKGRREEWRGVRVARPTGRVEWFRGNRDGVWKRGGL